MTWIPYQDVVVGGIAFLHHKLTNVTQDRHEGYLIYPYGKFDPEFKKKGIRWDRWVQYYVLPKEEVQRYNAASRFFQYRHDEQVELMLTMSDMIEAVSRNAKLYNIKVVGSFKYDEWDLLTPQELVYVEDEKIGKKLTSLATNYIASSSASKKEAIAQQWREIILTIFPSLKEYQEDKYEDDERFVRVSTL
jgi:hypothetical protein